MTAGRFRDDYPTAEFAAEVRAAWNARNWSLRDLELKSRVNRGTISHVLRGDRPCSRQDRQCLMDTLGFDAATQWKFLQGTDAETFENFGLGEETALQKGTRFMAYARYGEALQILRGAFDAAERRGDLRLQALASERLAWFYSELEQDSEAHYWLAKSIATVEQCLGAPVPIQIWAAGGKAPQRLSIVSDVEEDTIMERIEEAAARAQFVIVDLEGTASTIVVYAISQSDFVIVPTQGSQLDANEASKAIRVVLQMEKATRKKKDYAVLLTRTSPLIRTRGLAHIQQGLINAGIPVLETELNDRDAFKAVFSFQETLDGLRSNDVPNLEKARTNVDELVREILTRLAGEQGGGQESMSEDDAVAGAA